MVYPAGLRNVLGVGSTTPPIRRLEARSATTVTRWWRSVRPGGGVITTYPGGRCAGAWGTSFSTALVSGAAALLVQKNPDLDQDDAEISIGRAADRMRFAGMGRGRLNT